jgi:hypothetical protein
MCAVYERAPEAIIRTSLACYRGYAHFLVEYPRVLQETNIGSAFYSLPLADACSYPSDEVETITIEPWEWRLGTPEMPSPENLGGREEVMVIE